MPPQVTIYTDGACSGNPGPGGYGAIIEYKGDSVELSGAEQNTTNNRMEMMAAVKALQALKKPCQVVLYTDSRYVCDCFIKGWFKKWKVNGWTTSKGTPVANKDLWILLLEQNTKHRVEWKWVKGHSGHPQNDRCDELAVEARKAL